MCLFVHTELLCACKYTQSIAQKAGLYSVARLKMDLPFHNRLAFTGGVPAPQGEVGSHLHSPPTVATRCTDRLPRKSSSSPSTTFARGGDKGSNAVTVTGSNADWWRPEWTVDSMLLRKSSTLLRCHSSMMAHDGPCGSASWRTCH